MRQDKKTQSQPKKKILVVDDEPQIVEAVKTGLKSKGYDVICAYDGDQGLNKAHKENPDLIILDLMLPKMNGYKICRLLKYDKSYSHIPIIIFTARSDEIGEALAKEVGADMWLAKPFNLNKMIDIIEKLFIR